MAKLLRGRTTVELDERDVAVYAVGDVHGCFDELVALERRILKDGARLDGSKLIVMLGDYVDRGPRSADVVEHLLQPLPEGFERICLRGNHEAMMLEFLADPLRHVEWLDFGGVETVASYGVDIAALLDSAEGRRDVRRILRRAIPAGHLDFLKGLPTLAVRGNVAFVHAGVRPGLALERQSASDMLWIREPFISEGPDLPFVVVHGHTPGEAPVRWRGRVCVDTGAYYTGRLTALRIVGNRGSFLFSS